MFYTFNQMKDQNAQFMNAFVDLKVVGWKSYADALNSYTNGFFKSQLDSMTSTVETTGDFMKKTIKGAF